MTAPSCRGRAGPVRRNHGDGLGLEPCPFCGGQPEIVTRNVEPQGDPWYGRKDETFVLCDCGACLFDGGFHEGFWDAETRAVEAWNRRVLALPAEGPRMLTEAEAEEMGAKGAPATEQERLLFEAWMRGHCWALCATWRGTQYTSDDEVGGGFSLQAMATRRLWAAWRDRAALSVNAGKTIPQSKGPQ